MPKFIKTKEQELTEETVEGLVGKFIHVPTNIHKAINDVDGGEEEVNVWFAGKVVGYEKIYNTYDYANDELHDEPRVYYNILMMDGMGYMLTNGDLEILEVTEKEYVDMVIQHQATEAVYEEAKEIIKTGKPSIILPGVES